MPKRKREDGEVEGSPEPADPKQKRLQLKLEQGTVKLGHAFKVAKGFERQKLGRRQKTAASEKNEKNAQRIETEIAALKVRAKPLRCLNWRYNEYADCLAWMIDVGHHCRRETPPLQMPSQDQSCRSITATCTRARKTATHSARRRYAQHLVKVVKLKAR